MSRSFAVLELSGHIIDSLTLAKVIDKIHHLGLDYQVNDLRIGRRKGDVSVANLSLWADTREALDRAIEELSPYGVHNIDPLEAHLGIVQEDGRLPQDGYVRLNPPIQVLCEGHWLDVERHGQEMTIVVDSPMRARLVRVADLVRGDRVVLAGEGVRTLPED